MLYEKEKLGPYQERYLEHWERFLASNTAALQTSLKEIIARFKKGKPNPLKKLLGTFQKNKTDELRKIEFWHNAWELDLFVQFLNADEDIIENDLSMSFLFGKYEEFMDRPDYQLAYPDDCDVYLEGERESLLEREKFHRFFFWLAKNWMACGGHHINVLTTTEENSVRRIFNLNHINWFDNIQYLDPCDAPFVPYPLQRDLTDFEIEARIKMENIQIFKTIWRYLEKGEQFVEFAYYNLKVYQRSGQKNQFKNLGFTLVEGDRVHLCQQIDHYLNQGFYEVPRPEDGPPIHEHLVEWRSPAFRTHKPRVTEEEWQQLESQIGYPLPGTYKWFVTHMDQQERLSGLSHFQTPSGEWRPISGLVKIAEFVDALLSLHKTFSIEPTLFPLFKGEDNEWILMDHQSEAIYLLIQQGQCSLLHNNLQDLLGNCCEISQYFCPRRVHLEKGNALIVQDWIDQGWDMSDLRPLGSRSILSIGDSDEVKILLLKNGADPNSLYIYGDQISRSFLDQLIAHGLDLKKKFEDNKGLQKSLARREGFEDLLERYGVNG